MAGRNLLKGAKIKGGKVKGYKGGAGMGFVAGVAVGLAAPVVISALAAAARPAALAAFKAGMMLYEKSRETFAEINEIVEDVVAEVRADMQGTSGHVIEAEATPVEEPTAMSDETGAVRMPSPEDVGSGTASKVKGLKRTA